MIRKFKPAYWLYNFFKKDDLAYNIPLYKKYGINKKYYDSISSADFVNINSPVNKYDEVNSRDVIDSEPAYQLVAPKYREAVKSWSDNGFVVLENFFSAERVDAVNKEVEELISNNRVKFRYGGKKIMFAFHISKVIAQMGDDEELKRILNLVMGKEMDLFQSINFIKGSEQRTHSDSIHMSTFPYGNLAAIWIALEDITIDNGPLHYYPGSHKLPYLMNDGFGNQGSALFLGEKMYEDYEDKVDEIVQEAGLKKEVLLAKKGDVFIWHANLLHGGNKMNDPDLTRKSVVFHYYAQDAICYHELTQRPSLKPKYRKI